MFKLTIGNSGCVISDFDISNDCFYPFDARTEIFDICEPNNGLVDFLLNHNANDDTLDDAKSVIQSVSNGTYTLSDIESIMGRHNVSFPIIDIDGALWCNCNNTISVILSVLRYLAKCNYKFSICAHCGKPFCVKKTRSSSARKYCERNSPCILDDKLNYTHLTCEQAVRNIKQQFSRMRKRCYDTDYNSVSGSLSNAAQQFLLENEKHLPSSPSVEELAKYYTFLKDELDKRRLEQ